jgi:hypothetical protein
MNQTEYTPRPPTQQRLAELFAARATRVGRRPERAEPGSDTETTVLVLLRRVDLAALVRGTIEFAASLSRQEAAAWQLSWTKTRFLFGNPANLTGRTPARVLAAGGNVAWLGPFVAGHLPGLSRLLKPVTGRLPELAPLLEFPPKRPGVSGSAEDQVYRQLQVAVRGLTFSEYLVHLHHTLAEAVLLGQLRPGEPLRLLHLPDLAADTLGTEPGYARVHYAASVTAGAEATAVAEATDGAEEAAELRLYTCLLARTESLTDPSPIRHDPMDVDA